MKTYSYKIDGSNGEGKTWTTRGNMTCELIHTLALAMEATYAQLTNGEAVYGHPGEGGCRGPYHIHRVVIETVAQ